MALSLHCPQCRSHYQVDDRHAGKRFSCKKCQTRIRIPALATSSPEPPPTVPPAASAASSPPEREYQEPAPPFAEFTIDTAPPRRASAAPPAMRPIETEAPARRSGRPPLEPMPVRVWWALAITGGLLAFLLVLGLIWPLFLLPFALCSGLAAFLLCGSGYIWCLVDAFGVDSRTGLMYLFVPFYPVYYLFTQFHRVWRPWLLTGTGLLLIPVTGMMFMFGIVSIFAPAVAEGIAKQPTVARSPDVGAPGAPVMPMPAGGGLPGGPMGGVPGMGGGGYGGPPFGAPPGFAPPASGVQTVSVRLTDERGMRQLEPQPFIEAEFASLPGYLAGSVEWDAGRRRLTFRFTGTPGDVDPFMQALVETGFRLTGPPIFKPAGVP